MNEIEKKVKELEKDVEKLLGLKVVVYDEREKFGEYQFAFYQEKIEGRSLGSGFIDDIVMKYDLEYLPTQPGLAGAGTSVYLDDAEFEMSFKLEVN